jgi:hypothetical protein
LASYQTHNHAYALLFLSQVYAVEKDEKRHAELGEVLKRAADWATKITTTRGGWGYVPAKDGGNFDEGCCTTGMLHALYAAQSAGVRVPQETLEKGWEYLDKATVIARQDERPTKTEAGVLYALAAGGGGEPRPPLTLAALALALHAGQERSELAVQWLNFCVKTIPSWRRPNRFGSDDYIDFYLAFVTHALGEQGHSKLRPDMANGDLWTWSRFRSWTALEYAKKQNPDGSWPPTHQGPIYSTAVKLIVLQLDRGHLTVLAR